MRGRGPLQSLAASPTMVGAVTMLIAIVAVFLAYNANNGLPFVPVYRVSVEVPNAARLTNNNEVRIGGYRVGVIESIEPVQKDDVQTTAASDGAVAAQAADDTGGVAALLNLKLDKTAEPLPAGLDFPRSLQVCVRPQVPRGRSRQWRGRPGGVHLQRHRRRRRLHAALLRLRAAPPRAPPATAASRSRRNSTTSPTPSTPRRARTPAATSSATATRSPARGFSLNIAIENLKPLLVYLKPVADKLAEPATQAGGASSPRSAAPPRSSRPSSEEQAELFTFMATTFTAISSDPEALKETISEGVPTLADGDRDPAAAAPLPARLRHPLGRPAPRRLGPSDHPADPERRHRRRDAGAQPLGDDEPGPEGRAPGAARARRSTEHADRADPPEGHVRLGVAPRASWVVPAQTNCNYWNYFFTNLPNGLSDPDQLGFTFRQALTNYPLGPQGFNLPGLGPTVVPGEVETPMAGYTGIQSNGKVGGFAPPDGSVSYSSGEFAPYELPILTGRSTARRARTCPARTSTTARPVRTATRSAAPSCPARRDKNPAIGIADLPGSRGPTTLFWDQDSTRELRDTRVSNRQPADLGEPAMRTTDSKRRLPNWAIGLILIVVIASAPSSRTRRSCPGATPTRSRPCSRLGPEPAAEVAGADRRRGRRQGHQGRAALDRLAPADRPGRRRATGLPGRGRCPGQPAAW